MIVFKYSKIKLSDKLVYGVVKSKEFTLFTEIVAKESITCKEKMRLLYGLKLGKLEFLNNWL